MRQGQTPGGRQQERQAGRLLLVLALAAVLPLAALAAFSIRQQVLLQQLQTRSQLLDLSRVAAESAEGFALQTSDLLSMLARHPAVLRQDAAGATEILAAELGPASQFEDIWAARADGSVYADPQAEPGVPSPSIAGQPFFQQAMQSGRLSFQSLPVGTSTPAHVDLILCFPVLGPGGHAIGTVQARFNPGAVHRIAFREGLPPDASLTVVDAQGTIVVQTTDPARWVGRGIGAVAVVALLGQPEAFSQGVFLGQPSVASAHEVAATPWHVVVTQPAALALAPEQMTFWGGAVALAGLLAVALFLGVRAGDLSKQGWDRQAFLQTLLEAAPIGIAVVGGPDDRLEVVNPVYSRIIGRPQAELLGRPMREVLPEPVAGQVAGFVAQVYRTGHTVTVRELPVQTAGAAQTSYWDVEYVPLPSDGRRAAAILILAMPVTEKVLARQRVEEQATLAQQRAGQLQAVLAAIPDCIWIFDAQGMTVFANESGRHTFSPGLAPEDVQRVTVATWPVEMYRPDGTPIPLPEWAGARAMAGEATFGEEFLHRPEQGSPLRWARLSAAPVRDAEGRPAGAVVTAIDITAEKEAQAERERLLAEVEAARQELQTILSRLPDGVLAVDLNQRFTLRNDTMLGYLGRDVLGQSLADLRRDYRFTDASGRPFAPGQTPIERALKGEAVSAEVSLQLLDGRRLDVLESAAPLYGSDEGPPGRVVGAVAALTDITVEKQAQAERERLLAQVEEARRSAQAVLDQMQGGILVVDAGGRVEMSNETLRRELGHDLVGLSIAEVWRTYRLAITGGQPPPSGETPAQRALKGETVSGVEIRAHLPDGREYDLQENVAPLRDASGRIAGAVVTSVDIAPRKRAEAERDRLLDEVQSARESLQTTLNQLPDVVLVFDRDLRVTLDNEVGRRLFGRPMAGLPLAELVRGFTFLYPDGRPIPPERLPLRQAAAGQAVRGLEMGVLFPDGRRIDILVSAAPLRREAGAEPGGVVIAATDITALRQVEAERERLLAEVQTASRNLQQILTRLPDGVMVVDTSLRVTFANDAFKRLLGRDVQGMSLPDMEREMPLLANCQPVPPQDRPVQRVLRGDVVTGQEVVAELPGGRQVDLLLGAVPIFDTQGHISAAVVTSTDISPQKQAQAERERLLAEVQAAHENLQAILNRLPDGVVVIDPSLHVTLSNAAVRQYLGRDLVGMSMVDLAREFAVEIGGRAVSVQEWPVERALRGEDITGQELVARLPGDRRVDVLLSVVPMRDAQGRITSVVLTATDITPQKQAQAERERLLAEVEGARRSLRAVLDQLPEGVLVLDRTLRLTLTNDTVRRYVDHELAGMQAPDLWREFGFAMPNGQPFPPGQTPVERALRGESVIGVETSFTFPDGRHIDALDSAAPLYSPDGTVREVAMVFTNITPLKELDRAKDQFLSTAAHELRTPLTSLKGHNQMLLRRARQARWRSEDMHSLETMDGQVDRLNELIGRLLDVSRIRLGRLQLHRAPTDIVALARQVAEELQMTTEAHRISVQAEEPELVGRWDASALRQVLTNLVSNAIKYSPGGPIDVRIRREGKWALVSVSDRGPGISPERQEQLFEPFAPGVAREYRQPGGLGLGLYISRGIVEAHGGRIWVESQAGVGSTFTFSLPLGDRNRPPRPSS